MGMYIKGIEMPTDNTVLLRIYPKGNDCAFYVEQLDIDDDVLDKYWAVPVPPHGRLIDADALCEGRVANDNVVICAKTAPTIIEAEGEP